MTGEHWQHGTLATAPPGTWYDEGFVTAQCVLISTVGVIIILC